MIEVVHRHIIPAAYDVLPPSMRSPKATALLLAIGTQESLFLHRRQQAGPARSLWQFEAAGVRGVLDHPRSAGPIRIALTRLCYPEPYESATLLLAIEHNDVLAACFARALLWTLPGPLPEPLQADVGWRLYLDLWRPGRPKPQTWPVNYSSAWSRVQDTVTA